jgi:hypothetical protein
LKSPPIADIDGAIAQPPNTRQANSEFFDLDHFLKSSRHFDLDQSPMAW